MDRSGYEPFLSTEGLSAEISGNEPGIGGERLISLYRDHLLNLLSDPKTTHRRRADIGDWLASVGDPRPGTGIRENGDGRSEPDLVWCPVPAGEVYLRDFDEPFHCEDFYIAQYPVTWAQYNLFLEDALGHADARWWDGLERRHEYERVDVPVSNLPAQEVSWYDAVAYCRWLSDRLGFEVRLPTEWEWEKAATDGDPDRVYAWGSTWQGDFANTRNSNLRRAIAVGMYPMGASPVGALDMTGNVLEWCINEFGDPRRMDVDSPASRVMRGGSWFLIPAYSRTTFRVGDNPYMRFNSVGFRLVASSLHPRSSAPTVNLAVCYDAI